MFHLSQQEDQALHTQPRLALNSVQNLTQPLHHSLISAKHTSRVSLAGCILGPIWEGNLGLVPKGVGSGTALGRVTSPLCFSGPSTTL